MAITVEIPLRRFHRLDSEVDAERAAQRAADNASPGAASAPVQAAKHQCEHLRANGRRCRRAAIEGSPLCGRHDEWYRHLPSYLGMPYPEDAVSLQETMARAVVMVMAKELDARAARAVASLCRIMQKNLPEAMRELEQADWEAAQRGIERVQ